MMDKIEILRIAALGALQPRGEGVGAPGHGDEVDVIRHQTEGEEADAGLRGGFAEQFEVDVAVGVGMEDSLAVVTALGDVIRAIGQEVAGKAGHERCGSLSTCRVMCAAARKVGAAGGGVYRDSGVGDGKFSPKGAGPA